MTICSWTLVQVSRRRDVGQVIEPVLSSMASAGYSAQDTFAVHLGLEEAIVNAIRHGNGDDPTKSVQVRYSIGPQCVQVEVEDQGKGFDPCRVPDPVASENLERPSGRGLLLLQSLMQTVQIHGKGNHISFCRFRDQRPWPQSA